MTDDILEYPYFENPPLKEVSFLVQFNPIEGFHVGMLGLLWEELRKDFPHFEEAAPLVGEIEKFGLLVDTVPKFKFEVLGKPERPRAYYISDCGQWLIQVQADRFGLNWRNLKECEDPYPRYRATSAKFFEAFHNFKTFLNKQGLQLTSVLQLELLYINHMLADGNDPHHYFNDVLQPTRYPPGLVQEALSLNLKHTIIDKNKKIGRLFTAIASTVSPSTGNAGYQLQFIAKAFPESQEESSISARFSQMRNHINFCFRNLTTSNMHKTWGLKED